MQCRPSRACGRCSTSGIRATGLKKCIPTSRSGCSRCLAHRGDRESRRVRREHALVRDHSLELAEHLSLHVELLEDGLDHEVALLEARRTTSCPIAWAASDSACSWSSRPRAAAPASSSRIVSSARSTIAWSRSRRTTGSAQPAQEQRRELRGHEPGAGDPDLRHRARLGGRATGASAGTPLDEVERVERRLRLRREEQVGERLLLGPVALLDAPGLGAFDQVERPVRRRRRAVQGVVEAGCARARRARSSTRDRPGRGSAARARS